MSRHVLHRLRHLFWFWQPLISVSDANLCWFIMINVDWCWLICFLIGWLMLIYMFFDADWCWLMLIDGQKRFNQFFFGVYHQSFSSHFFFSKHLGRFVIIEVSWEVGEWHMQFARLILPTIATSISGVAKVVRRYYLDTTQFISGRQEASRRAHPPLGGRPRCSPRCRCQQPHPKPGLGGWSSFRHRLSQKMLIVALPLFS